MCHGGIDAFVRPQEVSITLWAFAKTQQSCPQLIAHIRHRISAQPAWLRTFSSQALSNLMWSLAKLHPHHAAAAAAAAADSAQTGAAVLSEIERRPVMSFKPQELSQVSHALATWGGGAPRGYGSVFLHAFHAHVESNGLGAFEDKHLACVAWMCGLRLKVRSVETPLSLQIR